LIPLRSRQRQGIDCPPVAILNEIPFFGSLDKKFPKPKPHAANLGIVRLENENGTAFWFQDSAAFDNYVPHQGMPFLFSDPTILSLTAIFRAGLARPFLPTGAT
jgi:hypothetical protein